MGQPLHCAAQPHIKPAWGPPRVAKLLQRARPWLPRRPPFPDRSPAVPTGWQSRVCRHRLPLSPPHFTAKEKPLLSCLAPSSSLPYSRSSCCHALRRSAAAVPGELPPWAAKPPSCSHDSPSNEAAPTGRAAAPWGGSEADWCHPLSPPRAPRHR
jgi:hypothetical protein